MMDDRRSARHEVEPTVDREDVGAALSSDDSEDSDGEFEFPFVSRDPAAGSADELFAGGGRVRTFYPVFGRVLDDLFAPEPAAGPPSSRAPLGRLFQLEKARTSSVASSTSSSSSSSSAVELDGASPDSYCLWTPGSSPASSPSRRPPRKSGSTGSMARWRRIGELVVGRSHSDGRDKFLFLSAAPPSPDRGDHASSSSSTPNNKAKKQQARGISKKAAGAANEVDTVAAGRRVSASYGAGGAAKGGSPAARRTFLPYQQDVLVGLFANVHGLRRTHHRPF